MQTVLGKVFWAQPYRVPPLTGVVVLLLIIGSALYTFVQGYDLTLVDNPRRESDVVLRALEEAYAWGFAMMACSLALIVSLVTRVQFFVWLSHVALFALFAGSAVTTVQFVGFYGGDGYDELVESLLLTLWNGIFAVRLRPTRRAA